MRRTLAPIIVAAIITVAGCTGGQSAKSSAEPTKHSATPTATSQQDRQSDSHDLQQTYFSAMRRILPSRVQISSGQHELGSGILFDNAGNVVTNAHVVGQASTFTVRLGNGGSPWSARLVGVYAPDDLAVLHLKPAPHGRPATFANSAKVQP